MRNLNEHKKTSKPLGIYIHWPFCLSKCPYCDFNSHVTNHVDYDKWGQAFENCIKGYADTIRSSEVKSIFFGGGTPSLMPPALVERIINALGDASGELPDEITLEANPTSVEIDNFKALSKAGITRVSIGIQSFNDGDLSFLGREHSSKEALKALEVAKQCFDRVSFDLIYALPGQTVEQWEKELNDALSLGTNHLALYQLTIEPQTPFYLAYKKGDFDIPDEDLAAQMYQLTDDLTSKAGLRSYEVSNYAREGQECRHNMIYWEGQEYIGIGPGAHGRVQDEKGVWQATRQHRAPEVWLDKSLCEPNGAEVREAVDEMGRFRENVMMGLRMDKGISLEDFPTNFIDQGAIKTLVDENYLHHEGTHIKTSREGRLVLDSILDFLLNPTRIKAGEHLHPSSAAY